MDGFSFVFFACNHVRFSEDQASGWICRPMKSDPSIGMREDLAKSRDSWAFMGSAGFSQWFYLGFCQFCLVCFGSIFLPTTSRRKHGLKVESRVPVFGKEHEPAAAIKHSAPANNQTSAWPETSNKTFLGPFVITHFFWMLVFLWRGHVLLLLGISSSKSKDFHERLFILQRSLAKCSSLADFAVFICQERAKAKAKALRPDVFFGPKWWRFRTCSSFVKRSNLEA